jgi:hypothetical protein
MQRLFVFLLSALLILAIACSDNESGTKPTSTPAVQPTTTGGATNSPDQPAVYSALDLTEVRPVDNGQVFI